MRALALAVLLASPAPARAEDPALKAEVAKIVDLFYGHDFERAAPAAAALEAAHPGHPVGPLFRAIVEYQRWTASGLRNENAWKSVERDLGRAEDSARALAKTSPAESHYYLGAAQGFRARGLAARHSFVRALADAASSLRHLKKALALDPTLTDARLGLGMYHYFAARMPAAAKPFASLLVGEPGDRDKGLAELWSVARSDAVGRMEARAVLAMILSKNDEADWTGAEALLSELMTRYPRNPVYRLRRVLVAEKRGDLDAAFKLADPDGKWIETLNPDLRDNARAWASYRAAEIRLFQGKYDDAGARLAAIDLQKTPKGLSDWVLVRRGNLEDALGRRDAAKADYARASDKGAGAAARAFADKPYAGGPAEPAPFFSGY